uniref:SDR family oxidoreductase n=1 Tax=Pseudarthrobacter sp. B4EP4b TaxID=2590664 RepID=UPI001150D5F1
MFGDINVLVNTAGVGIFGPVEETTPEQFTTMFRVNQLGVFLGIKHVAPSMRTAGGGSIINIASGAGLRGLVNMSCYSSTKWAVRGLTRSAAIELGPDKIR